jgi:hypothetical protein
LISFPRFNPTIKSLFKAINNYLIFLIDLPKNISRVEKSIRRVFKNILIVHYNVLSNPCKK